MPAKTANIDEVISNFFILIFYPVRECPAPLGGEIRARGSMPRASSLTGFNRYPNTKTLSDSSTIFTKSLIVVTGQTLLSDLERTFKQVSQAKITPSRSLNS